MYGDVSRHMVEMFDAGAVRYCAAPPEQVKPVKQTALSTARSMDFVSVRLIPHATLKDWNNVNIAIAGHIHEAVPQRGYEVIGLRLERQQITVHVIRTTVELFMSIIHQGGSCQKTALLEICKSISTTEGLRDLTFAFLEGAWNYKIDETFEFCKGLPMCDHLALNARFRD